MNSFRISLCEVLLGCNINCLELNQFQDRFLCRQKSSIFSTRFTKTLEWIPKAASICPKLNVVYKKQDWKGFEYQRPWWLLSFLGGQLISEKNLLQISQKANEKFWRILTHFETIGQKSFKKLPFGRFEAKINCFWD